ncbi:MAG: class A sortase [Enterococcus sp.]
MVKQKKRRHIKNLFINLIIIFVLLIGLALVFNNQIKNFLIKQNGETYAVSNQTPQSIKKNEEATVSYDFDAIEPASSEAVLRAQLSNKKLPVIGGVALPSVAINLPIFKGLSNEALLWGAGTLSADQEMGRGNYALASHRAYEPDLLFSPLEKVSVGDTIYLTDLTNIYTYRTISKERVEPTRVDVLDEIPGKKLITLITCGEIGGITRIIVQGELTKTTPVDDASDAMLTAFEMEQKTY